MDVIMCCKLTSKKNNATSGNTAADFLSRLEFKVMEKIHLKIGQNIQTTPIKVTTSSSDVVDGKRLFFTQADNEDESEEETAERKKQPRENAGQWVANQEPPYLGTSLKEISKFDGNSTAYSMNGINANARKRVEQGVDLVLKNMNMIFFGRPHDEVLFKTDPRHKHFKANEDRINLKRGLLSRKIFGETSSVKYYQILIPKQLVDEVLRSLQGEFGKHPGFTRTIIAYIGKFYFPKTARLIKESVMSCEQCIREHWNDRSLARFPCNILMNTILRQATPCKLTCCRNYLHPVAMNYCGNHGRVLPLFIGLNDIKSRR